MVSARDATALFELCPTALVFGMWDSTGPKGGLGAKFERAMVAEIVGIDAVYGVKTSSRIDPVNSAQGRSALRTSDGGWLESTEQEAKKGSSKTEPKKYGKKLSELNLGNVTPSFGKYTKGAEGRDPLAERDAELSFRGRKGDDALDFAQECGKWIERHARVVSPPEASPSLTPSRQSSFRFPPSADCTSRSVASTTPSLTTRPARCWRRWGFARRLLRRKPVSTCDLAACSGPWNH